MRCRFVAILSLASQLSLGAQEIAGVWTGTADMRPDSGFAVNVRLKIDYKGDSLRAAFSLPESHLIDLELPSPYSDSSFASYKDGHLHAEFTPDIGLSFIGHLVSREEERIVFDGDLKNGTLAGEIRITGYRSPIVLRRETSKSPREPSVHFLSKGDSLRLGGKLILPKVSGPFPAVVFVTGSDPDTREAWQVEARALADKGVASLLYDKRGVGESSGASHDLASWDDLANDVEGAVAFLRSRTDVIKPDRIGLIGQSQGTWIITKVAARDPRIRFLVNISGGGMSAAEQETYRTGALMASNGFSAADVERAKDFQRRKFNVARTGLGWQALDSTMKKLRADSVKWFPGYGTGAAAGSLALLRLFGVLQFNYDPTVDLRSIKAPVFNIMGERDVVFPPQIVIDRVRSALLTGGNRNFSAVILPGTSHGMGMVQTYNGKGFRRAINPQFISTLANWVSTQAQR
jgi:pimeloyl-ACP methyl ester carboxylesterase